MANEISPERVTAVVVNWNGGDVVNQCIESLVQSTYASLDVVVVDNGSTDGSPQSIKKQFPTVHLIENRQNLGYAAGANQGIQAALAHPASHVLLVNNDLTVDQTAVLELTAAMRLDSTVGITGAKILRQDDPARLYCVWEEMKYNHVLTRSVGEYELDRGQYDQVREVDCVCGAAMLVRREVFERVGLFDPIYFAYQEQVDFTERARQQGIKSLFVPRARVWHHGEYSVRSRNALFLKTYLLRRNSVIFMRKHGHWRIWPRFLFWVVVSVMASFMSEFLQRKPEFFRARIKGFWDGFRMKAIDGETLFSKF